MAASAKEAYDAGASVMHLHFRNQTPGLGRFPSWEPDVAAAVTDAVRAACPDVIINMSTGVIDLDQSAPIACMDRIKPEIAACNAGTLNYLKARRDGTWAWPPMTFQNPVEKINEMLDAMKPNGTMPEFECFDVGIVRSVNLYVDTGMCSSPHYNFVMGVASGMPCDPDLPPPPAQIPQAGHFVGSHSDRPLRSLGPSSSGRRARWLSSDGSRGHVLPSQRREGPRQRRPHRCHRSVRT